MSNEVEALRPLPGFQEWLVNRLQADEVATDTGCVAGFQRPVGIGSPGEHKKKKWPKKKKKGD